MLQNKKKLVQIGSICVLFIVLAVSVRVPVSEDRVWNYNWRQRIFLMDIITKLRFRHRLLHKRRRSNILKRQGRRLMRDSLSRAIVRSMSAMRSEWKTGM